jgi:hypothetical protein
VADCIHYLLKLERHRFILVSADVLIELLVELLDNSRAPALHLIVHKLHLLRDLFRCVRLLPILNQFLLKRIEFWREGRPRLLSLCRLALRLLDLKLVEFLAPMLIIDAECIDLLFVLTDCLQQARVDRLTMQELGHDLLHV